MKVLTCAASFAVKYACPVRVTNAAGGERRVWLLMSLTSTVESRVRSSSASTLRVIRGRGPRALPEVAAAARRGDFSADLRENRAMVSNLLRGTERRDEGRIPASYA